MMIVVFLTVEHTPDFETLAFMALHLVHLTTTSVICWAWEFDRDKSCISSAKRRAQGKLSAGS
jgi:hypothetical protein